MQYIKHVALTLFVFMGLSLTSFSAMAEPEGPHQRIEKTTASLLALIEEAKTYFDKDPDRFYRELTTIIDPLVDFKSFTRSVMGDYGTRAYYSSLNKEQKTQYKKDYQRFIGRFKAGLVNTYGKGLLAFGGQKIQVVAPDAEAQKAIAAKKSVTVKQEIQGSEKTYTLEYKMRPSKQGEWLLRNVSIEGINIGQLYRNQFMSAMDANKGDFAAVIDNWVVDAKDLKAESDESEKTQ